MRDNPQQTSHFSSPEFAADVIASPVAATHPTTIGEDLKAAIEEYRAEVRRKSSQGSEVAGASSSGVSQMEVDEGS